MSQDYICGIVEEIWPRETKNGEFWSIKVNGQSFGFGKYAPKFGEDSEVEFDIKWNGEYANVDWDTFNVLNQVGSGPQGGNNRGGGRQGGGGGQRQGSGGQRAQGGGYGGQRSGGGQGSGQRAAGGNGRSSPASNGPRGGSGGGGGQRSAAGSSRAGTGSSGGGLSKDDYWSRKEVRDLVVQQHIQFQASRNAAIAALDSMLKVEAVKLPTKQADKYDAYLELLDTLTERFNDQTSGLGKEPSGGGRNIQQYDDDNPQQYDDDNMPAYEPGDECCYG